jgi:ribonucleoside-diphosphate reductase alpha chain
MAKLEGDILRQVTWNGTDAAKRVLSERYLIKKDGKLVETPEEMFMRVARAIASAETAWGRTPDAIEEVAEAFYKLMATNRFMPNSPTLMNAGKNNGLQYSACYVLPVDDSIDGIFEAVKRAAQIHQSGGGTGFSFSRLRPKDASVKTTGGKASGPVSFMRVFNAATEAVKQGGTRRGANMGILRVDHPDILDFINCKRALSEDNVQIYAAISPHVPAEFADRLKQGLLDRQISNFNISVAITDEFMKAVKEERDYDLIAPNSGAVVRKQSAREVFDMIIQAAWETGDPGLVFIDRINNSPANPTPTLGQVEATNPCGEQPLYPNEACNLGSLNLASFIRPNGGHADIDWDSLRESVQLCIRFLDDVIEVNPYPLKVIDECVKSNRRVGLGVMGWSDMLMKLAVPYDSEQAVELGGRIMKFINEAAHEATGRLAEERGAFPTWANSIYADGKPARNATVTTIAPTGTISIIGGCSSGIEPVFALAFQHVVGDRRLTFINPVFEQMASAYGFFTHEVREEVLKKGTARGVKGIPEQFQRVFVTAHEVAPEWHIRHQAAFQAHTDNGVSKTINLTHDARPDDIRHAYQMAYDLGCIGITVFRDGCKGHQVLNAGIKEESKDGGQLKIKGIKSRPQCVSGTTSVIGTPVGSAFVTINEDKIGEPLEVFIAVGRAGSDVAADAETIGRLLSLALRFEAVLSPRERLLRIAQQLVGIGGSRSAGFGHEKVRSLADGVGRVLMTYLAQKEEQDMERKQVIHAQTSASADHAVKVVVGGNKLGEKCPSCRNTTLVLEEGCKKCHSCGHSEC